MLIFFGCKKSSTVVEKQEIKTVSDSSKGTVKSSTANRVLQACPYPCEDPRCASPEYVKPCEGNSGGGNTGNQSVKPMTDIFRNLDFTELKKLLDIDDEPAIEKYLHPLAARISNQINQNYGINLIDSIGDFPQAMIMLGLFEYGKENNITLDEETTMARAAPTDNFNCFSAALNGIIGLNDIRGLYKDFVHGVSPRTILKTLKTFGKIIFTAVPIGWAFVELADCLDWI